MLRKLFVVAMVSFMSSSIFAGSHGNIFKAQGTCANKHSAMRMMGELPLHIGGEMNCSDQIQIKGDRTDMGSTCTYSGHTELGQPPMLNWVVTCHSYDAKEDSIFWRASGNNPVAAGSSPGKATILTGTGKYKGISGSGTMTWKQSVPNMTDPMRWGHSYQASLKFSMP